MDITVNLEDLAHLLNIGHGELKESLTKDGKLIEDQSEITAKIRELHDENLEGFSSARKKAFDDGFKKAQKKVLEDRESELRSKYDVEGDTLESIVEAIESKARKNAKLNPSDVKNSEIYINDIQKLKDRVKDLESELDSEKSGRQADKVNALLDANLPDWIKESGKALSDKPEVRQQQLNLLKIALREQGVEVRMDGDKLVPYKDDSVLVDEKTMKELTMSGAISQIALFLPDAKSGGGQSPGNRNDPNDTNSGKFDFSHVKTAEDMNRETNRLLELEDSTEEIEALIAHGEANGL